MLLGLPRAPQVCARDGAAASRAAAAMTAGAMQRLVLFCSIQELQAAATSPASERKFLLACCSS